MKGIIVIALVAANFNLLAHWFLPKNNFKIPVGYTKKAVGVEPVTEEKFNAIIDHVEKFYAPVVESIGGKLKILRKWKDGTVNAYASRQGSTYTVAMFGGLARHKEISPDGFALVVCHELGHHIGGAPRYSGEWASSEGQSDYWATKNCAKKIFSTQNNVAIVNNRIAKARYLSQVSPPNSGTPGRVMDDFVRAKCEKVYKSPQTITLCIRTAMGGKSLAYLLADLRGSKKPQFTTPDPGVVTRTNPRHPAAQCRLDTYFQGALCDVAPDVMQDPNNPDFNSCNRRAGHEIGTRPLCWFKPENS